MMLKKNYEKFLKTHVRFIFLLTTFILFIFFTNCDNQYYYKSPEELSKAVFQDIKRIKNYDDLTYILKFTLNRDEINKIIDESEEYKDVNIEEYFLNLQLQLTKWIMGNIQNIYPYKEKIILNENSHSYNVLDISEYFLHKSSNLIRSSDKFLEKKKFVNTRWYPYDSLLTLFNEYIKNGEYLSLTRGEKTKRNGYIKQILWKSYIHFKVNNEEKKLFIETLGETKKGWKILVLDD